jgi:hypothetical protein
LSPSTNTWVFVPRLKDAAGATVLDSVFPHKMRKGSYPVLWPLVDDLSAGLGLRPGQSLRHVFHVRKTPSGAPATLELDAYELMLHGLPRHIGTLSRPLAR